MITRLTKGHELMVRRMVSATDPLFGMHRQLRDYFLTDSPRFGTVGAYVPGSPAPKALGFWAKNENKAFIHHVVGDPKFIGEIADWLCLPVQLFVRDIQLPEFDSTGWEETLKVTPGLSLPDHPAFSGVFARVAPRFAGSVFERGLVNE